MNSTSQELIQRSATAELYNANLCLLQVPRDLIGG